MTEVLLRESAGAAGGALGWSVVGGAFGVPTGYVKIALKHCPFIVDIPMKHGELY